VGAIAGGADASTVRGAGAHLPVAALGGAATAAVDIGLTTVLDAVVALIGHAELRLRVAEAALAVTASEALLAVGARGTDCAATVDVRLGRDGRSGVGVGDVLDPIGALSGDAVVRGVAGARRRAVGRRQTALSFFAFGRAATAAVDVGLGTVERAVVAGAGDADHLAHVADVVGAIGAGVTRLTSCAAGANGPSTVDVGLLIVAHAILAVGSGAGLTDHVANLALTISGNAAALAVGAGGARSAAVDVALARILDAVGARRRHGAHAEVAFLGDVEMAALPAMRVGRAVVAIRAMIVIAAQDVVAYRGRIETAAERQYTKGESAHQKLPAAVSPTRFGASVGASTKELRRCW
jgi:hypothetical protein